MKIYSTLLLILVASCGSRKVLSNDSQVTVTKTVKEVIRDTVITTVSDSTYYLAWISCKENVPVILKPIESPFQGTLKPPKVVLKNNILKINCVKEAEQLFFKWKEKYRFETSQEIKTLKIAVPRDLTWWQKIWIATGKIAFGVVIIIIGVKIWRLKMFL